MKIGILTGGGDCPGLNPVIRAIVRRACKENDEIIGIRYGWKGLLEKETFPLDTTSVSGILHKGGTILGTSRTNPYKTEQGCETTKNNFKELGLDALITIGGEDTLGVASKLYADGLNIIGVPKTIDNDLEDTDFTFGFDTSINIVMDCIDRLHTTAESHNRIMIVEVMGRHTGWIATYAGIAGGADYILIPEKPINPDEVCQTLKARHDRGKNFSIVVVAEGAFFNNENPCLQEQKLDEFGHVRLGGIGQRLAKIIEAKTGYETRVTVLGHIQRGGRPSAFDRVLGTRLGVKAYSLVKENQFGKMVSLKGNQITAVDLIEATKKPKTLDLEIYEIAKIFFG
jgi:ATP-dependent phosphofructokinase / diphosphate-dependent phosphofructokinase